MALTASHKPFIYSGGTDHTMKVVLVATRKAVLLNISIGTAGENKIKAAIKGEPVVSITDGKEPVTLNRVIIMSEVEHSLVFVSSLCDNNYTVKFTNEKCVEMEDNCMIGVDERGGEMCSINLQGASDKAMEIANVAGGTLSVWNSRLAHAERNAITKMEQSGAVRSLGMTEVRSLNNLLILMPVPGKDCQCLYSFFSRCGNIKL